MTCWRECVPPEFAIDLEQLKVSSSSSVYVMKMILIILGLGDYLRRYNCIR